MLQVRPRVQISQITAIAIFLMANSFAFADGPSDVPSLPGPGSMGAGSIGPGSMGAVVFPHNHSGFPHNQTGPGSFKGSQFKPGSTTLQKLSVPPSQAKSLATKLSLQFRDLPGVSITPDVNQGELIVMAAPAIQFEIKDALATLTENAPAADQVRLSLRNTSASQVESVLAGMTDRPLATTTRSSGNVVVINLAAAGMPATSIEVDRGRGEVVIRAPSDQMAAWRKAFNFIDQKPLSSDQAIRMVQITRSGPAPIQRAVRLLSSLGKRSAHLNRTANTTRRIPVQTVGFGQEGDGGTGANGGRAKGNAGETDDAPTTGESESTAGAGLFGDVQIEFVPEIGQVIIKGSQKDIDRVREVISQIEEQSEVTKPDVEVVALDHVDSAALADLLKQIYDDVLSARQGQVSVTALDTPNSLLLIGRTEAIGGLMDLIKKLDQPSDDASRLRVYRLQNASAVDAEETIRSFFVAKPGEDDANRPGLGTRVRIQADYRTNSLIVQASPRDLEEVTKLIQDLDALDIPAESQLRVIPLGNAVAEDLAEVIQDAIAVDDEGTNDTTVPSSTLSILGVDSTTGQILQSGVLSGAVVTADSNSNALIVRAPSTSMPLIVELIRQLDQSPGIESLVKVFTIENGDALQLTTALQDLFGDNASTSGTSIGAANLAGLPPSTASGGDNTLVPLRFSTDQRTNSIIASGSAEDLEVVESILLRLDTAGFAERITEVVWLRHQAALDVATALQSYVQQRTQTVNSIQQFQNGLGPLDLPDRDLIVVAEPVTNSLLISVAPRLYEDVRRLIDQLDRRPTMVMIKVVIAEVGLDDGFEIGGEFGLQDSLMFNRSIANSALQSPANPPNNGGFNFNNNNSPNVTTFGQESLAGRGLSTFGLGVSSQEFGYGGFVLSAANESISMLFRSLQDANRLQILSRPQVMTLDNTEALVQVGRTIARVTGVINNVANTQLVTEDIQVGLILSVLPRVGSDGLIVMSVDATRSERDPLNGTEIPTENGAFVTIDDIIQTTAQSNIAAYSGQTVVFGGLIQKQRQNISRRVPYLADIPLIGTMFRFDRETESRSELLVIMTPTLVTGEEDLEYLKQVESSRMSWCLADVVEMHGDVGLSGGYGLWGPATGGTIYPDLHPTADCFDPKYSNGSGVDVPMETSFPSDGSSVVPGSTQTVPIESGSNSYLQGSGMHYESVPMPSSPAEMAPPTVTRPAMPISPISHRVRGIRAPATKYRKIKPSYVTPKSLDANGGLLSSD